MIRRSLILAAALLGGFLLSTEAQQINTSGGGAGTTINPTNGNIPVRASSTAFNDATATNVISLFSACSGTQYLGADGACHSAGSGSSAGVTNDIQIAGAGNTFVADSGNFTYNPSTHTLLVNGGGATPTTGVVMQVGSGGVTYPGSVTSSGTFTADNQARFFSEEDTWTPSVDGHGAAGYEAGVTITGTHTVNHYAAFESNPHYQGTGAVSAHYGFHDGPTIQNGATVQTRQAFHCDPVTLSGTGAVNTNECIYAAADTAGSSSNWFIVSDKVAPSYIKGQVAVGGANNPAYDLDANSDVGALHYKLKTNGDYDVSGTSLFISQTAPTIAGAGCGGSAASIPNSNGTAAFTINVGTAPASTGCTVTMPAAAHGWACTVTDITTNSTSVSLQKQVSAASPTTSVLLKNFSDVSIATAPTASDIYQVLCGAY